MSDRPPKQPVQALLTPYGRTVAVVTFSSYVAGWWLGWLEMMMVACGGLVALGLASLFVIGKTRLSIQRHLESHRVTVDDEVHATLTVSNSGRGSTTSQVLEERVGTEVVEVSTPNLTAGAESVHSILVPTSRRGVLSVGPTRATKRDPLNLLCRAAQHTPVEQIWVRPRVTFLAPIPVGRARDMEGATSDSSPAGDVSFHTLRDYQIGDDPRHVHWLSSARTGTLMVRHYVDNRVPEVAVVLDTRRESWARDRFELGVEIAASVMTNSLKNHLSASLHLGTEPQTSGACVDNVLDVLTLIQPCPAQPSEGPSLTSLVEAAATTHATSSLMIVVTGDCGPRDLAAMSLVRTSPAVILVRVGQNDPAPTGLGPKLTVFDVDSLREFQLAWDREMK